MSPDRLEKLMEQVLSEVRDLRQNMVTSWQLKELETRLDTKIDALSVKVDDLERNMGIMQIVVEALNVKTDDLVRKTDDLVRNVKMTQIAVLETSSNVKRVEAKLDTTIDDHGARLDRLESAAHFAE
ncbi:MAG: hypothetical protein FWD73_09370 [Polyangiaceae bacterium]|nr:hypothetical protein [Polyangiaceae bacterium]